MDYELTVIVPTRNEAGNVALLYERLSAVLAGTAWEALFVDDDSPDGTAQAVEALQQDHDNVRLLLRTGRRGLSSACIEGMEDSTSPLIAVMDADLQHDETLLPAMLGKLAEDATLDIVVASRFASDADLGAFPAVRRRLSVLANRIGRWVGKHPLDDPMSGFFLLRRPVFEETAPRLSGKGFKILLDLFATSARPLRFAEVPLHFGTRHSGESKLDFRVVLEFGAFILDKVLGVRLPTALAVTALATALELATHLFVLIVLFGVAGLAFADGQVTAAATAAVVHAVLAEQSRYRDERLQGGQVLVWLFAFLTLALPGMLINLMVAEKQVEIGLWWPFAGLVGAAVGALWNGFTARLLSRG